MKKLCCILVCILLAAAMAVTAAAATSAEMTISASETKVLPGDTVSFSVSVSQVEDCRSAGFMLNYDKNVFEFVSGKCSLSETALADFSDDSGVFALGSSATVSGEIFTFQLKVKNDTALGEYSISANGNVRTSAGAISTTVNALTVTVSGEGAAQTEQTESAVTQDEEPEIAATQDAVPTEETEANETTVPTMETENTAPQEKLESVEDPAPDRNTFPWWLLIVGAVAAIGGVVFVLLKKK